MAVAAIVNPSGSPSYRWPFTGTSEDQLGVSVPAGWATFGPDENAVSPFALSWQWSDDEGVTWYNLQDSETTDPATGLKTANVASGHIRPVYSAHTSGTTIAVWKSNG